MQQGLALPFHGHVLHSPHRPALVVAGTSSSYRQLGDLAATIAALLADPGNGAVERVGILASRSLEAFAGILSACWAGVTFVPLNPKYPEERLATIIRNSQLSAIVLDSAGRGALTDTVLACCPDLLIAPCLDDQTIGGRELRGRQTLAGYRPIPPAPSPRQENAYILFTSGTTGEPKGVMVTVANVAHFLAVSQDRYRLTADDRVSQQSELTFDHIVFDLFMAWGAGKRAPRFRGTWRYSFEL